MNDDERILAEAQRKLEANRRAFEREQSTSVPARITAPRDFRVVPAAPGTAKRPTHPAQYSEKPSAAAIQRYLHENIPERFRDVTWWSLPRLRNPLGAPSLGAVESPEHGLLYDAEAVLYLSRRVKDATQVVLFGETRAGKSLVAAAMLAEEIMRGNDRARWVHAPALQEPEVMARALSSSFLVLDDVGYELNGAPAESGWLPQLRAPVCKFLGQWYLRRGARLVVTTFLNYPMMGEVYGAGATARVYECSTVIKMHRGSDP